MVTDTPALLLKLAQACLYNGAIAGALHGIDTLRQEWVEQINSANRIDLFPIASDLADFTRKLQAEQLAAAQSRQSAFAALSG